MVLSLAWYALQWSFPWYPKLFKISKFTSPNADLKTSIITTCRICCCCQDKQLRSWLMLLISVIWGCTRSFPLIRWNYITIHELNLTVTCHCQQRPSSLPWNWLFIFYTFFHRLSNDDIWTLLHYGVAHPWNQMFERKKDLLGSHLATRTILIPIMCPVNDWPVKFT